MLHFRMDMPYYLMAFYGSIMIVIVLLLRSLLKNRLPRFVFPAVWGMVLMRLLVPFALSSPLSLPLIPDNPFAENEMTAEQTAIVLEDKQEVLTRGNAGQSSRNDAAADSGAASGIEDSENNDTNVIDYMEPDIPLSQITYVNEGAAWHIASESGYAAAIPWRKLILPLYFLGAAAVAGILGWQKYCYTGKLKGSFLMEHNETVNSMLRSMGMGHILVFTNDEIASPMVCGLFSPRIYLPTRMNFQDKVLLGNIFAHETMHIRRKDNWKKAVMLAALCLNWYNPLVWSMAKCLASDLEAACDEAVLKQCDEEGRKDYARSLLAMAVTAGRSTLLYSAFSKTEVEKRIKGIVNYKKTTVFVLLCSILFMTAGAVAVATGGQAPFSPKLTAYCGSAYSRWGVSVSLTRDIALGEDAVSRAENVVFAVLREDVSGDRDVIEEAVKKAMGEEFGVEKRAFEVYISLCLAREEVEKEYEAWEITRGKDGFWLYQGEPIRVYEDKALSSYQSREEGTVDISVQRDRKGEITSVTVWRPGDTVYDERTKDREEYKTRRYGSGTMIEYDVDMQMK